MLDLVLVAMTALAAFGGYRLGFLARTTSWFGMALGLFVGARSLPWLFTTFEDQDAANLLLLGGVVLLLGSFLGQAAGVVIGSHLRVNLPSEEWAVADRFFGAVVGVIGVVLGVWLLLPTMAEVPGIFASQTRNSVVARAIDRMFPEPPDTLVALRRLVGEGQFPRVFDAITPAPDLGPPPADPGLGGDVMARVTPSVVKVTGIACRRLQEGSGFVVLGSDVVVTNAHVVAGEHDIQVERNDGVVLDAFAVVFDSDRDLAILRAPGLARTPLPVADVGPGATGGVFGFPGGGDLRVQPFQVGDEVRAIGTDIYDRHRTERQVLVLSSNLRPGDSGSALVDGSGTVVGVAFAIAPDDPSVAYALDVSELEALFDRDLSTPVDTGACL